VSAVTAHEGELQPKREWETLMPEITLTIQHKVGLHARPAARFVQTAKKFKSDIRVTHKEREANAKSILNVLTLGANQGAVVTIYAKGEDADQALATLEALIADNFGETG
jgi:phosphotransferase system HPr (HPr) family protein